MEKLTYLLGAGASARVLPLIRYAENNDFTLPNQLESFAATQGEKISIRSQWSKTEYKQFNDIIQKCKAFGTPDLAAKYFLETKDEQRYRMLKLLLSLYFKTTEDLPDMRGAGFEGRNLDPRVVPFLTTIAQDGKIPPNIRILSWNYDTQIDRGAALLHPATGKSNDFQLNFHVWPFKATDTDRTDKDYFLLHLNGIAGYIYSDDHLAVENPYEFEFNRPLETLLSFAWEGDESFGKKTFTDKRLELAKKMVDGTTILVVIGYSFPFFNRNIDKALFSTIYRTLKKVYFQDPFLDGQFLYTQFGLPTGNETFMGQKLDHRVEIQWQKNVSQYYVPFEL